MTLADALEATRPEPEPCRVGKLILELDDEDQETLRHALQPDSGWAHAQIASALSQMGIKVHPNQVGAHRRGVCSCP